MAIVCDDSDDHLHGVCYVIDRPVYLDRDAIELDVDASVAPRECYVGSVLGTSSAVFTLATPCCWPPFSLSEKIYCGVGPSPKSWLARYPRPPEHPVRRHDEHVFVLELNPRASRTVPFLSKDSWRLPG